MNRSYSKFLSVSLVSIFLLFSRLLFAQAPQSIPYQGVVRNALGQLMTSKTLMVRVSLLDSLVNGPVLYSERHQPVTTSLGMFSIIVGTGTVVSGNFGTIDWSRNAKFLKVEVDTTGTGASYTDMGTQQMLSVPYALYAGSAGATVTGKLPIISTDTVFAVSYRTATVRSSLSDRGSKLILAKGVCLSTSPHPNEEHAYTVAGSSLGSFDYMFSELIPNTTYYAKAFATTTAGTSYGREISFTISALKSPSVSTDTLLNISAQSVLVSGSIADDGGSSIIDRGFVWGKSINPSLNDSVKSVDGGSIFNTNLITLTPNTQYHVRAYATNSEGTGYGSNKSFSTASLSLATITTAVIINNNNVSFTGSLAVSARVTNDGGSMVSQRGFCYSTSAGPTLSNTVVSSGSGIGIFSVNLTSLAASTTYYIRAFATNSAGTIYSSEVSFITAPLSLSNVSTSNVFGISTNMAASGGNVTNDGGTAVTQRGICWSTLPSPTLNNFYTINGSGTGSFNASMTGLAVNTKYYVRAYAINTQGTAYGSEYSFTTSSIVASPNGLAVIGTSQVTKTDTNYIIGGYVSTNGGSAITDMGIYWNKTGNPSISDSIYKYPPITNGFFSIPISMPSTCQEKIYFRAFARNSNGNAFANNTVTLSTGLPLKIGNDSILSVTSNGAIVQSEILSDGGCAVTERGLCWSYYHNPTVEGQKKNQGIGTGKFETSINNLVVNTTYYYRTYAINSSGIIYGQENSFTTLGPIGFYVGQEYAGGYIFYIDSTGNHGLVCAKIDQSSAEWGCQDLTLGLYDTTVGSGQSNTAAIVAACSNPNTAAKVCDGLILEGYDDWFLPSQGELLLMYKNLFLNGIGNFTDGGCGNLYWSSTECKVREWWACGLPFSRGCNVYNSIADSGLPKWISSFYVRAVRKF